jgi:hypothetical protein
MFLINSAFVGKIFLYVSKCTVKQQLKLLQCGNGTQIFTAPVQLKLPYNVN